MTGTYEWGAELPVLRGERILLRGIQNSDAEALLGVFGDPEVARYWSAPALERLEQAQELVARIHEHFARRSLFQWGVVDLSDGALVGTTTLCQLDHDHRRAEIGFALRSDRWGRGLGSAAVEQLLRFAFDELDLHRIEADADPRNAASLALLERQGFRREGYLRERWHVHGGVHDAIFLGLLRPEWPGTTQRSTV